MSVFSYIIEIYPSLSLMLEVILIALVIALIGAVGYGFFVFSMKDDRADIIRSKLAEQNPWGQLLGQDAAEAPRSKEHGKGKAGFIRLITVLVVLILLLLAIKYGWFGISYP